MSASQNCIEFERIISASNSVNKDQRDAGKWSPLLLRSLSSNSIRLGSSG